MKKVYGRKWKAGMFNVGPTLLFPPERKTAKLYHPLSAAPCILWSSSKTLSYLLFSGAPKHWDYTNSQQDSNTGETDTSPFGVAPQKARMLDKWSNSFSPQGEAGSWRVSSTYSMMSWGKWLWQVSVCLCSQWPQICCPFLSAFRFRQD